MKCLFCLHTENITEHHLIPKCRHKRYKNKKNKEELQKVIPLCIICHKQIHALFSETVLAQQYDTPQKLLEDPQVITWINWIKKKR